jgi:hypothetical protein
VTDGAGLGDVCDSASESGSDLARLAASSSAMLICQTHHHIRMPPTRHHAASTRDLSRHTTQQGSRWQGSR